MRILLVEDDKALSSVVKKHLLIEKFDVDCAYDGIEALDFLSYQTYDTVVMDIMMPRMDGLTLVKQMRANGLTVPVLMLTAKSFVDDKVEGLDAGADDYLAKPFIVKELLARIRALCRRSSSVLKSYSIGNLTLDPNSFSAVTPTGEERLTAKEYKILELFIRNQGVFLSSEKIIDDVWNLEDETDISVLWVFISSLRKKLNAIDSNYNIKASRGIGYRLEEKK